MSKQGLKYLKELHPSERVDSAVEKLTALKVEVPSWALGRGGTRFAVYSDGSEPTSLEERIAAAGKVHKLTGRGETVALHFPWDGSTDDGVERLSGLLSENGVRAGAVNPNLFTMRDGPLDARLRFGSLTNPDAEVRKGSIDHCLWCVETMRKLGSTALSMWLPDGTNSPGQFSLYEQADLMEEGLKKVQRELRPAETMYLEYKFFEPAFYATAVFDWGRALDICRKLGENVTVLVDLGHHAHGTLVEQIVSMLAREGRLGGFHLNDSNYADDDLTTGSLFPGRLFRIFAAMLEGQWRGVLDFNAVALMIDESHNVKDPVAEMIESVESIEVAYARALLVDYDALDEARRKSDATGAERILASAFRSDVRSLLEEARRQMGAAADPLSAYLDK